MKLYRKENDKLIADINKLLICEKLYEPAIISLSGINCWLKIHKSYDEQPKRCVLLTLVGFRQMLFKRDKSNFWRFFAHLMMHQSQFLPYLWKKNILIFWDFKGFGLTTPLKFSNLSSSDNIMVQLYPVIIVNVIRSEEVYQFGKLSKWYKNWRIGLENDTIRLTSDLFLHLHSNFHYLEAAQPHVAPNGYGSAYAAQSTWNYQKKMVKLWIINKMELTFYVVSIHWIY